MTLDTIIDTTIACRMQHHLPSMQHGICDACYARLAAAYTWLSEAETCALVRQLFTTPIPYDGTSGPLVHTLLRRIQAAAGPARYTEWVAGAFPDRLRPKTDEKPPKTDRK